MAAELDKSAVAKKISSSLLRVFFYVVLYVVVAAVLQWFFTAYLVGFGIILIDYLGYVQVLTAVGLGYLIVKSRNFFLLVHEDETRPSHFGSR
jgi:small conductance mechanosensitive channel